MRQVHCESSIVPCSIVVLVNRVYLTGPTNLTTYFVMKLQETLFWNPTCV